jgi:hypothetical protein
VLREGLRDEVTLGGPFAKNGKCHHLQGATAGDVFLVELPEVIIAQPRFE